jgi:peptide/nickel transport system permease protein
VAPSGRSARDVLRDPVSALALATITAMVVAAALAPWVVPSDPLATNLDHLLAGPSRAHPLGTDGIGRDVLSRLVYGARWSLGVALLVTTVVTAVGLVVGAASGYAGGRRLDLAVTWVVDALLAFPTMLLALAVIGAVGPGLRGVLVALVAVGWATTARVVRGEVLALRERDYVTAARAMGAPAPAIVGRHVLPNVLSPLLVLATVEVGQLILALAGLSFLGLGVQSPTPEWGTMINEGRSFLFRKPELMIYPGVAISVAVVAFNVLGDRLRDVLDPRLATGPTDPGAARLEEQP